MKQADEPLIERRLLTQTTHDGHEGLFTDRPNGYRPVAIVMHATGSGRAGSEFASLDALGDFFQRNGVAASHFAVDRNGRIMQYVSEDRAAFHVSRPGWNGISIGIELLNDNTGAQPFPPAQMRSTRQLVQHLGSRYGIPAESVVQHRDIQPKDRSDPASNFGWDAFTESLKDPFDSSTRSRRSTKGSQRLTVG